MALVYSAATGARLSAGEHSLIRNDDGDIWVFGYGSLMWNPGFPHVEVRPATLRGYHRAFCLYSEHYRGTPERRGLVLGLDRGGSCVGRAFRIAAGEADAAMDYLIKREMFGHDVDVYVLKWLKVALGDDTSVSQPVERFGNTSSPSPRGREGRGLLHRGGNAFPANDPPLDLPPAGRGERIVGGDRGHASGSPGVRAACFVVNRAHEHYAGKLAPERIAEIVGGASGKSGSNREYLANTIAHLDELGIADGPLHRVQRLVAG